MLPSNSVHWCLLQSLLLCSFAILSIDGASFTAGVGSFDPTPSAVVIWTRFNDNVTVTWFFATTDSFGASVIKSGTVLPNVTRDYTIRVLVTDLQPFTEYFYKFTAPGAQTEVGRARTLPQPGADVSQIKFAAVSCASYAAGMFWVYAEVAKSDAHYLIMLGDYIYEYPYGGPDSNNDTKALGRIPSPNKKLITLDDYRQRYLQARQDLSLQAAHLRFTFIVIWDDHEFANDAWRDGAEGHNATTDGPWNVRVANAMQAWYEYLPLQNPTVSSLIYRTYQFGNLLSLHMLEERLHRDEAVNMMNYMTSATTVNLTAYYAQLNSCARSMLGVPQRDWLTGTLRASSTKYQVLGSSTMMMKIYLPLEILILYQETLALAASGASQSAIAAQLQKIFNSLSELVAIKQKINNGIPVNATEQKRISTIVPYNVGAFDGYGCDRDLIYQAASGKNTIVLSGDSHHAWYGLLRNGTSLLFGKEFSTASVTTPRFDLLLTTPSTAVPFEQALLTLVDDLRYVDIEHHGYMYVVFTPCTVTTEYRIVSTVRSMSYTAGVDRVQTETYACSNDNGNTPAQPADNTNRNQLYLLVTNACVMANGAPPPTLQAILQLSDSQRVDAGDNRLCTDNQYWALAYVTKAALGGSIIVSINKIIVRVVDTGIVLPSDIVDLSGYRVLLIAYNPIETGLALAGIESGVVTRPNGELLLAFTAVRFTPWGAIYDASPMVVQIIFPYAVLITQVLLFTEQAAATKTLSTGVPLASSAIVQVNAYTWAISLPRSGIYLVYGVVQTTTSVVQDPDSSNQATSTNNGSNLGLLGLLGLIAIPVLLLLGLAVCGLLYYRHGQTEACTAMLEPEPLPNMCTVPYPLDGMVAPTPVILTMEVNPTLCNF